MRGAARPSKSGGVGRITLRLHLGGMGGDSMGVKPLTRRANECPLRAGGGRGGTAVPSLAWGRKLVEPTPTLHPSSLGWEVRPAALWAAGGWGWDGGGAWVDGGGANPAWGAEARGPKSAPRLPQEWGGGSRHKAAAP